MGKSIRDRIEAHWDAKSMKMDWLGLEQILQDILREANPTPTLLLIDEAIGAYTRRGQVYPRSKA